MSEVLQLLADVEAARTRVLQSTGGLSSNQGAFKATPECWSAAEVLEHLVLAEQGGINYLWRAVDALRAGELVLNGDSPNHGLRIEEIVERTWRPKEKAPESAMPRMGGPIGYWRAALEACRPVLVRLGEEMAEFDLSRIVYPHFLSGPLDARQRLEFIRFHLDRHAAQILAIRREAAFPAA